MTLSRSSAADSTDYSNRSSFPAVAKRNFEDYASSSPDYIGGLDFVPKMKKHGDRETTAITQQNLSSNWRSGENSGGLNRCISLSSSECSSSNRPESTRLQLFVRMISGGKTIVIHADKNDTVEKLHQRIEWKTKIPGSLQRVIYRGKQLQYEHSLAYYSIEQDAMLHLVARMQSTDNPVAWQTIDDIMYTVSRMYKGENLQCNINEKLNTFFQMMPTESEDSINKYLMIFSSSSVLAALVMLYISFSERNRSCAKSSINLFLNSCLTLSKTQLNYCVPIVLDFCKLLRDVCPDKKVYISSRNTLGSMLKTFDKPDVFYGGFLTVGEEIFPFFTELSSLLVKELDQNSGPSSCVFHNFSSMWQHLEKALKYQGASMIPFVLPLGDTALKVEIELLHRIFTSLLTTMELCMCKVESLLADKEGGNSETMPSFWSHYLAILKIMSSMSNLYQDGKEQLAGLLNRHEISFCTLIVKFAKRGENNQWIFEYKEATNFEARRHLAMLLFPDVKEDFDEMFEMLIDRSNLLAESFEYIVNASPDALHGGLFMEFKNEEATGPGVLREWFYLVCQEIFSPQNTLFLRSTDDIRRFSPNPASKVDPLHRDFFEFTGRVIALSLMHKVQVGVLFDPVFFLQLAGQKISLEDIKDTDRIMYNSCKQILEMDPVFLEQLDLTFVLETEELGKRETIELCEGGRFIAVHNKNRKQYVDLLIERRFAIPITDQVKQFSRGFTSMLSDSVSLESFFEIIRLDDLDGMLRGGENPISIDDWKAHTKYTGFIETDPEIEWFWKVLKKMTEAEQRSILFFWTSNKYVPVEGFRGLSSKLHIYRLYEANDRLPVSHTCFYRLCIPRYTTMSVLEQRLRFIAQDHVSSSFGKW